MILEVQTRVGCWGCNDPKRLDSERRQIGAVSAETSYCASAKCTVHAPKQTEEHWAAIEVVT
jgi:hypothetical protein